MWAPSEHPKQRTEAQILRSLVENGVAKRFDLRAWSDAGCKQATAAERLHALLEQVRPDVAKLIVLEELEGTPEEDADSLVYGEIAMHDFLAMCDKYGETNAVTTSTSGMGVGGGDAGAGGGGAVSGGGGAVNGSGGASVGRVFWDLGSGTGKAVMAAGLCRHFAHARGVELLPCTAGIAAVLVDDFARDVLPGARPASNPLRSVTVECGDFFEPSRLAEWQAGDFVFCNCVTWDDDTMLRLSAAAKAVSLNVHRYAAEGLRPGAVFVTVLCPLSSDKFELVEEVELSFSWGSVECLVHRRMTDEAAQLAAMLGESMAGMRGGDVDMEG